MEGEDDSPNPMKVMLNVLTDIKKNEPMDGKT